MNVEDDYPTDESITKKKQTVLPEQVEGLNLDEEL